MSVVIVGASLAGLRTAQALRRQGFDGPVVLMGEEDHFPYDRPPLSKEFLAFDAPLEPKLLAKPDELAGLALELRLGERATALDLSSRSVRTESGDQIAYEKLVIATGASPRMLTVPGADLRGVYTLRSWDDALALRQALDDNPRVVVVGGGFIGAEFAHAARTRGLDVILVERLVTPFALSLGERVGHALTGLQRQAGVRVMTSTSIVAAHGVGHVEALTLSSGETLEADLVVVGIGVSANTDWLEHSGLELAGGVVCDAAMRSVSDPTVFAAGDVACWWHPTLGRRIRSEHWTNANEHAQVIAGRISGSLPEADGVPYVWSDQFGVRLQIVGLSESEDSVEVFFDNASLRAAVWSRGGALTQVLAVDSPKTTVRARKAIQQRASADDFVALNLTAPA